MFDCMADIDEPHVFMQWKGTDACFDFHCVCGYWGHFDGFFAYHIKCRNCGRQYEMPVHLFLRPVDDKTKRLLDAELRGPIPVEPGEHE